MFQCSQNVTLVKTLPYFGLFHKRNRIWFSSLKNVCSKNFLKIFSKSLFHCFFILSLSLCCYMWNELLAYENRFGFNKLSYNVAHYQSHSQSLADEGMTKAIAYIDPGLHDLLCKISCLDLSRLFQLPLPKIFTFYQ